MLKSLLKGTLIHALCFQLLYMGMFQDYVQYVSRVPASIDHQYGLDELNTKIKDFKTEIAGKELEPDCGQESTEVSGDDSFAQLMAMLGQNDEIKTREDRAFYNFVDSLKGNACVVPQDSVVASSLEDKNCEPTKIEGFIEKFAKKAREEEKEEKDPMPLRLDDPQIRGFHQRALALMQEVRVYLADTNVEREERINLLVNYLGGVALPMRDLIVTFRAYIPREYDGVYFYESLLPEINEELIGNDELVKDIITNGPNKMVENFHLEIEEGLWGRRALRYNPNEVLARDIVSILKVPTKKNYLRAMKWMTLQMMLAQVFSYEAMLGETKPLEIPRSCQNHFNGDLPSEVKMQYSGEHGDKFLESILADHGLLAETSNPEFNAYYADNVNRDPMLEGYSGIMPFEKYRSSQEAIKRGKERFITPVIDDFEYFDQVSPIVMAKGLSVFHDSNSYLFGLMDFEDDHYFGADLIQKLFTQPENNEIYEFNDEYGDPVEVSHLHQNLSTFLVEVMQRHKIAYWDQLITPEIEKKLKSKIVKIDFPSLHGASMWRTWALARLEDWALKKKEEGLRPIEAQALKSSLRGGSHYLSSGKNENEHLDNLVKYLGELKVSDDYIPTRRLTSGEHVKTYKMLGNLWHFLRDRAGSLEAAETTEYDYLFSQMETGNPWARVRLSYLVLMEELDAISKGEAPKFTKIDGAELNSESIKSCQQRDVTEIRRLITSAVSKMKLYRPLVPAYATNLLKSEEKEQIWHQNIDEGHPLFKQKDNRGNPFYEMMEQTSFQTLLTGDQVQEFVREHIHMGLRDKAWEEMEAFFASEEGKRSQFYTELYKMKGNPDAQADYFEEYATSNGIDLIYDAKMGFLRTDNILKKSILKSLLRGSANLRKNEILGRLSEFCDLEPNDHENFQKLYFATSKSQNKLNQLTGAPTIPDEVLADIQDQVSSMSPDEWTDMLLGIGAGVMGMTAMLLAGACTGLTGGLCAPIGVPLAVAGASAMAMQANLVTREFSRKRRADRDSAYIKSMEELGFANRNSHESVERSWFWTIFEAVSIIPFISITARSIVAGTRITGVTAAMMARNLGPKGFRESWRITGQAARTIYAESDVRFSRIILGLDSYASQAKNLIPKKEMVAQVFDKAKGLRTLLKAGKLSPFAYAKRLGELIQGLKTSTKAFFTEGAEYTAKVSVKETPSQIDQATAKVVSDYFAGNPKGLQHLMSEYAKKIPKAKLQMERYAKGTSTLGKVTLLPWIRNGIRSLRSSHLVQYSDDIIRLEKELGQVVARNGKLEDYVLKNVDILTDIFQKIPARKRELPYMFFIQGGPHLGKSLSSVGGKTAKALQMHRLSNGIVMRKFFNARSRLIYESMKGRAREVLGLKVFLASEGAFESFEAFQKSIAQVTENVDEATKNAILKDYANLEEKLSLKIYEMTKASLENKGTMRKLKESLFKGEARISADLENMNLEEMRRILFRAETEHDRAIAVTIWSSIPVEKLFELQEIGSVAHRVIRELSQYENVEEFQGLLNALKVLIIKRDPGIVEIM